MGDGGAACVATTPVGKRLTHAPGLGGGRNSLHMSARSVGDGTRCGTSGLGEGSASGRSGGVGGVGGGGSSAACLSLEPRVGEENAAYGVRVAVGDSANSAMSSSQLLFGWFAFASRAHMASQLGLAGSGSPAPSSGPQSSGSRSATRWTGA